MAGHATIRTAFTVHLNDASTDDEAVHSSLDGGSGSKHAAWYSADWILPFTLGNPVWSVTSMDQMFPNVYKSCALNKLMDSEKGSSNISLGRAKAEM